MNDVAMTVGERFRATVLRYPERPAYGDDQVEMDYANLRLKEKVENRWMRDGKYAEQLEHTCLDVDRIVKQNARFKKVSYIIWISPVRHVCPG